MGYVIAAFFGFMAGLLAVTSPDAVCRNAAHAAADKTIVYRGNQCVRLTSTPLEIKP